jgi:2-dehydro-3-deoxyphosphooctonate aldolase (KDO 8-P synthase)
MPDLVPVKDHVTPDERVSLPGFDISFSNDGQLVLIAGPCVLEDQASALALAGELREIARSHGRPFVFKASYDKANRTRGDSYRGPGITAGMQILDAVRRELGVPVLTDVHSAEEARIAGECVDVVQVPAFLCRQTDILSAAGRTRRAVHLKKGQFLAPEDMKFAAEKVRAAGGRPIVCERGTSFGYRDLVVDMRSLAILATVAPVVFDATHAVQKPGGDAGVTLGERQFVAPLARAATAVGIAGLFLEVHSQPARALSDASTALTTSQVDELLSEVVPLDQLVKRLGNEAAQRRPMVAAVPGE